MDINNKDSLTLPKFGRDIVPDSRSGVDMLLKHLEHARAASADKIVFVTERENFVVRYFADEECLKEVKHSAELAKPIEVAISNRLYAWPELGDRAWATSDIKRKRFVIFGQSGNSCFAQGVVRKNFTTQQNECVLSRINWTCDEQLSAIFEMDPDAKKQFVRGLSAERGVVLVNDTPESEMGGVGAILAHKPVALLSKYDAANVDFHQVIENAKRGWVVLLVKGNDPVEILMNVVGAASSSGLETVVAELIQLVFVQCRVPRTCSACAMSTAVESSHIDQLPEGLKPSKDSSVLVGRGCESCGQTGYRGNVGIESALVLSAKLRELVVSDGAVEKITELAYRGGTKSLLEAGVRKVEQGKTTFQVLFKVVRSMSQAFAASMLSHLRNDGTTLKDAEINNALASIGSELFADEKHGKSSSKRLLLVEDDEDQMQILRLVFEKADYEVIVAHDGVEALDYVGKRPVDVIVCDLMMPRMNGKDFVENLRLHPHLKNTPVMILTAVESPDAEEMLLSTGADDYCVKSVRRSILLKRVERLVARAS